MSRVLIAFGFMGIGMFVAFIAGFAFAQWGYEEQKRKNNQWN